MIKEPNKSIEIRFYGTLNDFLRQNRRQKSFEHRYSGSPTVKDLIESLGVPHVEVSLVLVNGNDVNFDFHPQSGDRVSCYSRFHSIEVGSINLLKDEPNEPKFVLDVHLGKLAKYLRLMGFDTLYRTDYTDDEILKIASEEERIILTCDLGILRNGMAKWGYYIRSRVSKTQLIEVMNAFSLHEKVNPFSRCAKCNGLVEVVSKAQIIDHLDSRTSRYYNEFFRCSNCRQIYWEGSHFRSIEKFINENLKNNVK